MQNYFKMYNGDKCIFDAEVSCVSDPIQASLKEILLYEIRLLSYYTLKLKEFNFEYKKYAKHSNPCIRDKCRKRQSRRPDRWRVRA